MNFPWCWHFLPSVQIDMAHKQPGTNTHEHEKTECHTQSFLKQNKSLEANKWHPTTIRNLAEGKKKKKPYLSLILLLLLCSVSECFDREAFAFWLLFFPSNCAVTQMEEPEFTNQTHSNRTKKIYIKQRRKNKYLSVKWHRARLKWIPHRQFHRLPDDSLPFSSLE